LAEAEAGVAIGLRESDAQAAETGSALRALPDLAGRRAELTEAQNRLAESRRELAGHQFEHDRLVREAEARTARLAAIDVELRSWEDRAATATGQIEQLAERRQRAGEELEKLAQRPAEIAEQRSRLLDRVVDAERERDAAADALAEAETELEDITARLRATESRLADEREERVRCQAAVEHADQSLAVLAERIAERLECDPDQVLASVGLSEEDDLPELDKTEIRLERLQRERDNMGPVNLRAEAEAAEVDERIRSLQAERDDLVAAIQRLRQGIAGLNREGRERLQSAFSDIDRHFRDLFTRLFGGGSAHLAMTDAEDPFESGLEVMASPPGKRLQSMSLLSGGEQALAALALLFAVFLTNPAPICVLDEVDAPLDDHNVDRFCDLVAEIAQASATRFLLITHHRMTMARMDRLYGVTMAERGVSQLVSVDLETAEAIRESA
jgi:chromosome segregation protein